MKHQAQPRRGFALIMVMVLIVMISLGAYSYTQMMTAQEASMAMSGRRLQARAAVASGVEYMKEYVMMAAEDQELAGGHWDNPTYFKNITVGGSEQGDTRFSIISIVEDQNGEPTDVRYGLLDESSRLNVNNLAGGSYEPQTEEADVEAMLSGEGSASAEEDAEEFSLSPARDALMELPGMTDQIADAILDWIDADDEPRDFGAEASAYGSLGYEPRNGPISSLDELLLVQGVTNELLYGADRNHNGILDSNEQSQATESGMARGWSAFLTTNSIDAVAQAEETIDLNQDELETLYTELTAAGFTEDFAKYVVVYRQSGPYTLEIPEDAPDDFEPPVPQPVSGVTPNFEQAAETEIGSVLDLLGSSSMGSFPAANGPDPEAILVQSPYGEGSDFSTVLPMMMSLLTAGDELGGSAGVSMNHCPSAVMSGLPDIDPNVVPNIMQLQDRAGASGDPNYQFPTWPLGLGAVSIEEMKRLLPYVAGNGRIFRAQIVGYSDVPGVFARAEVVIDASGDAPQVLSWRDLSHLGLGFSLDTLTQ